MKRRQAWFEGQFDLDPERLVFIDETWAKTNMTKDAILIEPAAKHPRLSDKRDELSDVNK